MIQAKQTEVIEGDSMIWELMPNHIELYHREIVTAKQADAMGMRMSSILWEKIGVGGQVVPHYHDVAEIIFITAGKVRLLCNGEWKSYKAGDTFHVPTGVIHSVANDATLRANKSAFLCLWSRMSPRTHFLIRYSSKTFIPRISEMGGARDGEQQ